MGSLAITDRQREILTYVAGYAARHGFPPTLREIGAHFGIASTNAVNDHLAALEAKGALRRIPGIARGIQLSKE